MVNPKTQEAVEWYSTNRVLYKALAKRVESIVREILEPNKINYHSISSRAKPVDSYNEKASKEKYKDPRSEINDMAGIRVITYTDSDAKHVSKIVEEIFEIYPKHSIDKTEELGIDRVGYRSIHHVGTLGRERLKLPENKIFKDMCFEIQIRTILQHAWAEFEHDRNYKFRGVLPKDMRRRLSLVAANLEIMDREFDDISKALDSYAIDVGKKAELGDLSVAVNSTSLSEYMNRRFETLIEKGIFPRGADDERLIEQILDMGINTIKELDNIVPKDYIKIKSKYVFPQEEETFYGIVTDILILHDVNAYFKKAWKNKWHGIRRSDLSHYKEYGIDLNKYIRLHNLDVL